MIEIERLPADAWPWIAAMLASLDFDRVEMARKLRTGEWAAFRITGGGELCLVASWGYVDGRKAMWIDQAAGSIGKNKREKIAAMLDFLEAQARKNDCTEIRVLGRMAWRRLLPDFELTEYRGRPVLRKALQ